jgi:hypothetical protein
MSNCSFDTLPVSDLLIDFMILLIIINYVIVVKDKFRQQYVSADKNLINKFWRFKLSKGTTI